MKFYVHRRRTPKGAIFFRFFRRLAVEIKTFHKFSLMKTYSKQSSSFALDVTRLPMFFRALKKGGNEQAIKSVYNFSQLNPPPSRGKSLKTIFCRMCFYSSVKSRTNIFSHRLGSSLLMNCNIKQFVFN